MKKTLSILLALVLTLALAAPMFASAEEAYVATTWEPFAERVSISIPIYDRGEDGYPAVDNNYWTQWIQKAFGEKYNVDVSFVAIPRNDQMTTYALLIADKKTPTILMEYDYPKLTQWVADGAMQPIDLDKFKEVAPNYYASMVANNQLSFTEVNDETYFVLAERPYYANGYTYYTFIRQDWLDAVGKTQPTNYAEYVELIDAIIAAGLTDKAPVGLSIPGDAFARNFEYREFPVDEKEWAIHSSLGTASLSWYPTERMLRRLNTEFNKGWYSEEFDLGGPDMTGTVASEMQADFINGKLYKYGGYMTTDVAWLTAFYENNPDAKLAIEVPGFALEPGVVDTLQGRSDNPFGMTIGFSSYATEDQLKAAWMYLEWMHNPEILFVLQNGIEGVTYTIDPESGLPVVDTTYKGEEMLNTRVNKDIWCAVVEAKKMGTLEQSVAAVAPQGLPQDFTQEMINVWHINQGLVEQGLRYTDPAYSVALDSESEYTATLLSLWQEYYVKLVKADPAEFDALYAEFSKNYLEAGYQEILDERLAAYEAGKTTKLPENTKK